jgi:hypothetical protein
MTYAIASLYYGLPPKVGDDFKTSGRTPRVEDALFNREEGFYIEHGGNASIQPGVFGIDMYSDMDECGHHTDLSEIRLVATEAEQQEFRRLYNGLDDELKADLAVFGEPRVFILWSSS